MCTQVTFLEFFEILLQCAEGWYSKYKEQAKELGVGQQPSLPVVLVTSDAEAINEVVILALNLNYYNGQ